MRGRSVKIIWAQGFRDSQKRHRLIARCQFYRLVVTFQQVATSFSILSSYNKPVKISLMLKQLATSLLITSLDKSTGNKSQLTTCKRLVVNKLSQAEHILISPCCNKLLQHVNRLVATCAFLAILLRLIGP